MRLHITIWRSLRLSSINVRRNRRTSLLILGVIAIVYFQLTGEGYNKKTFSAVVKLTQQRKQLPKGILTHPKKTCGIDCAGNIIITVISQASNRDRRNAIRQTWGHPDMQRKYYFCIYFILGLDNNVKISDEINDENADIVQVDIEENLFSLTDKLIGAFNWVTNYCYGPRLVFKINDDVYLDLNFLYELQDESYLLDDVISGTCQQDSILSRITPKYFTTTEEDPFGIHPPYCLGTGYVMTMHTARKIYYDMLQTIPFRLEDAFLGMVLYRLGMKVRDIDDFIYALDKRDGYMQIFHIECNRITHGLNARNIQQLWERRESRAQEIQECQVRGEISHTLTYLSSFIKDQGRDFRILTQAEKKLFDKVI